MGLTDREVAILSRVYDGMSTRQVAEACDVSIATVSRDATSAVLKLAAKGIKLEMRKRGRPPKTKQMDGRIMGRIFTDADKYNAR